MGAFTRRYTPKKPVFSFHVPKAGGISLRDHLSNYFDAVLPHYNYQEEIAGIPTWKMPTKWKTSALNDLAKKQTVCIHGHFRKSEMTFVTDYYPDAEQFITVLRDPLEMAVSSYFYNRRLEAAGQRGKKVRISLNRFLSRHVCSYGNHLPDALMNNPEQAIRDFLLIGTLERIDLFLERLAEMTGHEAKNPFPHANKAIRSDAPSEAAVAKWIDRNWQSVEVYDTVARITNGELANPRRANRFSNAIERFFGKFRAYETSR